MKNFNRYNEVEAVAYNPLIENEEEISKLESGFTAIVEDPYTYTSVDSFVKEEGHLTATLSTQQSKLLRH